MPTHDIDIGELRRLYDASEAAIAKNVPGPDRVSNAERDWSRAFWKAAPALLAAAEECEKLRDTLNKSLEKSVRLTDTNSKICAALCDCKSPTDHEDDCAYLRPLAGIIALKSRLALAEAVVSEQANDVGLWFRAETVTEDILQRALRRLHEAVEGKSATECAMVALSTYEGKSE